MFNFGNGIKKKGGRLVNLNPNIFDRFKKNLITLSNYHFINELRRYFNVGPVVVVFVW